MSRARTFLVDVGGVLASFVVLLALEDLTVGLTYRRQFVSSWEMMMARTCLSPILLAATVPLAIVLVALGHLAARRRLRALCTVAFLCGAALAYGVSFGRHFTSAFVRAIFVAAFASVTAGATFVLGRRLPVDRPRLLSAAGMLLAIALWVADAHVLKRLYPAFHFALFLGTLASWSASWLFARETRARRHVAVTGLAVAIVSLAWIPGGARRVAYADNLRRVLLEHAPLLGRAVVVAAKIAPPPPLEEEETSASAQSTGATTTSAILRQRPASRALDWTGHDIVLVTIDALRADHVSSYGYPRRTTPNIDELAARGTRFAHAYCPTPHTSYSITSMMTGKYMRPLLEMDTGADSETWAGYLRRYGFRTSAFYPPAIYFIDTHRFQRLRDYGLGFEYRKEEFTEPRVRREQIARYLATAEADKPLFLWLHLFEPHEPYVMHDDHRFSGDDEHDAYDSEIATADALVGDVLRMIEARKPGAVVLFSADHGEEFGEHGGRYHGSSVYEEQARVPLVVVGPGVARGAVVDVPVQTIDMLPTTLAALDIPLPARLRGRDLGSLLAGGAPADEGLAFSETDDYTMVARGSDRLICQRRIAACTLFDVTVDAAEQSPGVDRPERVAELRKLTAAIERENGKLEAPALPAALRRGLQGDRDAAEDVAPLFDDARADIRRAAARCAYSLRAPEMAPHLKRALERDEDDEVRRWAALALVRTGSEERKAREIVEALLTSSDAALQTAAALTMAEQGDARGEALLVARWEKAHVPEPTEPGDMDEAREILAALAKIRAKAAVPALARSLADVRLRPYVVDALAAIGDGRARAPLLAIFAEERYVDMRPKEARALLSLGAKGELRAPLARFAGVPDPMNEALPLAREAGLLRAEHGGISFDSPRPKVRATLHVAGHGPARLLVLAAAPGALTGSVGDTRFATSSAERLVFVEAGEPAQSVPLTVEHEGGILALWLVRRAPEVPPPPPDEWQGPRSDSFDAPVRQTLESAP